jgi:chemotaxis protein histidine kinase CheA
MDLIRSFLAEADELLSAINEQILELESDPSRVERVNEIYRAAHTLKGSANLYGFSGIAVVTHLLESLLGEIREGLLTPGASLTDLLLEGFDQVRTQVKRIASGAEDPQADPDLLYRLNQHVHMESGLPPVMDAAAGEPPRFNGTPEEWLDEVRSCIQQYVRGEGRAVPPIELLGSFPSAGGKQAYGGAGLSAEERISLVGEIKKSAANLQRRRRSTVQLSSESHCFKCARSCPHGRESMTGCRNCSRLSRCWRLMPPIRLPVRVRFPAGGTICGTGGPKGWNAGF